MMNAVENRCPECGASWAGGRTCEDIFHEFLILEFENRNGEGAVHFYTVANFMIQHQRYSPEGLAWIVKQLHAALSGELSIEQIRAAAQGSVGQDKRDWKVTRAKDAPIQTPMDWTITIVDIANDTSADYNARILRWAQSIVDTMDAEKAQA